MSEKTMELFKKFRVEKDGDNLTPYVFYKSDLGNFIAYRRERLNSNGTPLYIFSVQYSERHGFVRSLPPVQGARRNNTQMSYTMECYDTDQSFSWLLERLDEQLKTGFKMYEVQYNK